MACIAQRCAPFGVLAQRVNAAIHIHGRVVLHGAAVGGRYLVIRVAVGLQHRRHIGQQLGALGVAHGAQGLAAALSRKGKGCGQVQPRGIDTYQRRAQHRVQQRAALTRTGLPATCNMIGE